MSRPCRTKPSCYKEPMIKLGLNILAAVFAIAAAVVWWIASRVYTPKSIYKAAPGDDPRDFKKYVGVHTAGSGEEPQGAIPDLVRGVAKQSRLNARAAQCAAIAATLQAVAIFLP